MRVRQKQRALFGILALGGLAMAMIPNTISGQTGRAASLLEEAGARYQEISSFCATFEQVMFIPLLDETTTSNGSLCQAKPNLFAMRFTHPEGDLLVADGEFFWVYYPSSDARQVLQFEMGAQPGGVDFHKAFLENPSQKYELEYVGEESLQGRPTHLISLRPLDPSGFEDARIWLDAGRSLILRAQIGMENGSVRTVTLTEILLNPPADSERFQFVPPAGAQVIRRD